MQLFKDLELKGTLRHRQTYNVTCKDEQGQLEAASTSFKLGSESLKQLAHES